MQSRTAVFSISMYIPLHRTPAYRSVARILPYIFAYNSRAVHNTPGTIAVRPTDRVSASRVYRVAFSTLFSTACLSSAKTLSPLCIYTCRLVSPPASSRRVVAEMEEKCVRPSSCTADTAVTRRPITH